MNRPRGKGGGHSRKGGRWEGGEAAGRGGGLQGENRSKSPLRGREEKSARRWGNSENPQKGDIGEEE